MILGLGLGLGCYCSFVHLQIEAWVVERLSEIRSTILYDLVEYNTMKVFEDILQLMRRDLQGKNKKNLNFGKFYKSIALKKIFGIQSSWNIT